MAMSGRSTGGASQGLRRFCFLIWILVTWMVQLLNVLLGCTFTINAFFSVSILDFDRKVNEEKRGMFPNLAF